MLTIMCSCASQVLFLATLITVKRQSWSLIYIGVIHLPCRAYDGNSRPTQKSCTLNRQCIARAVIKRCTNVSGVVGSVLRVDTELLERCQALKQRSIAVMNFSLALVWRCLCGNNARFRSLPLHQRYNNAGFSGAPLRQRRCFPYFVRALSKIFPLALPFKQQQRSCGGTWA